MGYAEHVFPQGAARRHVAVQREPDPAHFPGGPITHPFIYRRITGAEVGFGGATEILSIDEAFGVSLLDPFIALLRYCRLDSDEVRVEWSGGQFARCRLPVREIPRETP
jgi:hypothetical protein